MSKANLKRSVFECDVNVVGGGVFVSDGCGK